MGIRFSYALVAASNNQLAEIAERCKPLLEFYDNPINYSLVCMSAPSCDPLNIALELIAFQSREASEYDRPPGIMVDLLQLDYTPPTPKKSFWNKLRKDSSNERDSQVETDWSNLLRTPAVSIAKIASDIAQRSLCVLYSDTMCSSGVLHFVDGDLVSGEVFGFSGTDVLFHISENKVTPSFVVDESGFNYADIITRGLISYFGDSFDIDSIVFEGLDEYQRYVLMESREFITPARLDV